MRLISGCSIRFYIETTDRKYRDLTVARTLLSAMERCISERKSSDIPEHTHAPSLPEADSAQITVLDKVDLT